MRDAALLTLTLLCAMPAKATIELNTLWDFSQPALSEQRLRAALASARGGDALILQTQIARSHSLRKDFAAARQQLEAIASAIPMAGPEAQARFALELGRSHASATHPPESQTAPSQGFGARRL